MPQVFDISQHWGQPINLHHPQALDPDAGFQLAQSGMFGHLLKGHNHPALRDQMLSSATLPHSQWR